MGPFDYVVPKAPYAIYEALSQYSFEKPALARQGLERSLGVGLVVAEGEVHRVSLIFFGCYVRTTST